MKIKWISLFFLFSSSAYAALNSKEMNYFNCSVAVMKLPERILTAVKENSNMSPMLTKGTEGDTIEIQGTWSGKSGTYRMDQKTFIFLEADGKKTILNGAENSTAILQQLLSNAGKTLVATKKYPFLPEVVGANLDSMSKNFSKCDTGRLEHSKDFRLDLFMSFVDLNLQGPVLFNAGSESSKEKVTPTK